MVINNLLSVNMRESLCFKRVLDGRVSWSTKFWEMYLNANTGVKHDTTQDGIACILSFVSVL